MLISPARRRQTHDRPVWDEPRSKVNKWSTGEDLLMTAVHAAAVPVYTHPKIVAVSAVQRHSLDYSGPLNPIQMAEQAIMLQKDPNSLHFLTENRRGEVRMSIVDTIAKRKLAPPSPHAEWYVPEKGVVHGDKLCTENLGIGCYVF